MSEAEFNAIVGSKGKVIWRNPSAAKAYLESLDEGHRIRVIFEDGRRSRGLNRLFHAIFREFKDRTGYSPAAAKEYLKSLYIEDGRGTHELGQDEGSDFAEFCQAWISEHL
jgi:hypothetical protein